MLRVEVQSFSRGGRVSSKVMDRLKGELKIEIGYHAAFFFGIACWLLC